MDKQLIFDFETDISKVTIPLRFNNPFGIKVSEIARIAAAEFQNFIELESQNWDYDFGVEKGKMFGVLVVQSQGHVYSYLGAISGKLPGNVKCLKLVPSVFDDSVGDFFINKGMTELTEIGSQIRESSSSSEITSLKEIRRAKSIALQHRLFENYHFLNLSGEEQNLLEIFRNALDEGPPSAAGECAAPKLLQYAIKQQLRPVALTEFWWGNPNKEKKHKVFYPACKDRCRPILEYMLEDAGLFAQRWTK